MSDTQKDTHRLKPPGLFQWARFPLGDARWVDIFLEREPTQRDIKMLLKYLDVAREAVTDDTADMDAGCSPLPEITGSPSNEGIRTETAASTNITADNGHSLDLSTGEP